MRSRPPGPRGLPVVGTSRRYARDPLAFVETCARAYDSDVVRFDLGPMETYMVTAPSLVEQVLVHDDATYHKPEFENDALGDLLGDGLLLSEGERWRSQRTLANPAFRSRRLANLGGVMTAHAETMAAEWADGDVRDVEAEMARVTVRIIVETMLGVTLDEERLATIRASLEPLGRRFEPDPLGPLLPDWAPTPEKRAYRQAIATLEDVVGDIVAERRGTEYDGDDPGVGPDEEPMDLLSILLRAQNRGEQTDEQLRDEMLTMLLAGHDTTALALTYTWFLLSDHPEAEARLHDELDAVLGGEGPTTPTAADARELEYTERVLLEAMRLYPPVYTMFREPQVDVNLGGYRVPAGSAVMLPQWAVHRSPEYYENPEQFDPDRWEPERRRARPQFSYFPFGGGPRHCIGRQFSLLEAKLVLATVAQRYRLRRVDDGPLSFRPTLTLHPVDGLDMRVETRRD